MRNGFFQYYKPGVLVALVSILGISIFLAKIHWGLSVSLLSVVSGILIFIDKKLWNKRPFSEVFWVDDFSGRYEGELEYTYRDENCVEQKGRLKHVKVIHQTGSRVSVFSFTIKKDGSPSTKSENQGMFVKKTNGDKHFELTFNYLNDGNEALTTHYGTDVIKFIRKGDDKILSGKYFTERLPFQTRGKYIDLKWVDKSEEHEF